MNFPGEKLLNLQKWLSTHFPGNILIPSLEGGKIPKYRHKNNQYTDKLFLEKGYLECHQGCLIILADNLIVIDIDDPSWAFRFESMFDDFTKTVCCKTAKGFHYYFSNTEASKAAGIKDSVRTFTLPDSNDKIPLDIKTSTGTKSGGLISIPPSPGKTWLRPIMETPILPLPEPFVEYYITNSKKNTRKANTQNAAMSDNTLLDIRNLINILSSSRADNYDDWIRLGWCLHNIDKDNLLEDWILFSSKSNKYKAGECIRLWENMRDNGLTIASLHMWAKQDNPEQYSALQTNDIQKEILKCNGSTHSIAKIVHSILSKQFVCATSCGSLWYYFNGSIWLIDKGCIKLRIEKLSDEIKNHFIRTYMNIISYNGNTSENTKQKLLLKIIMDLEDITYKEKLIKELRDHFYDDNFLSDLDSDPNIIAFTNGVWDLSRKIFRSTTPEDKVSMTVGYPYSPDINIEARNYIIEYLEQLHPNEDQRTYLLKTLARQLYGDSGAELLHIHAGYNGSAGNGKTKFFEILQYVLGDYIYKFPVTELTLKNRLEPHKPVPEYSYWRGKRILYCSEPNTDNSINSGVMKEFTGGEHVSYRLLFSNSVHQFKPMYKMHIMCNDPPLIDGSDCGVKRRIRKIDYISHFVSHQNVDIQNHYYLMDIQFSEKFKQDINYRREFLRYILEFYDQSYLFDPPQIILDYSSIYLDENNTILQFTRKYITPSQNNICCLKEIRNAYRNSPYFDPKYKISNLKKDIEKILKTTCHEQKKINECNYCNVFIDFMLVDLESL